jgi:hypothetical protein
MVPAGEVGRSAGAADRGRAGADALSMRPSAQRPGSGTAALYRHFGKPGSTLTAQVADRASGAVELNADELHAMAWQQALRPTAHAFATLEDEFPFGVGLLLSGLERLRDDGWPNRRCAPAAIHGCGVRSGLLLRADPVPR